jgi:hypothetical protein
MQPQITARSTLEARLADVVMAHLVRSPTIARRPRVQRVPVAAIEIESERDAEYASYVVLRGAVCEDAADTTVKVSREPMADFITTNPFVREPLDADDHGTVPYVRYSAPYERIDIQHVPELRRPDATAVAPCAEADEIELDVSDLVAVDVSVPSRSFVDAWFAETGEGEANEDYLPRRSSHAIVIAALLVGALALGAGVGRLLI